MGLPQWKWADSFLCGRFGEDDPLDLVKELRLERHSSGFVCVSSLILHVGYTYMKYRASETRWELSSVSPCPVREFRVNDVAK